MDYPIVPWKRTHPSMPLNLRFWQVAQDAHDHKFISPFQEMRQAEGLTPHDIAGMMVMDVADYIALENGQLCHDADDLLDFCEIVGCHPLDLYKSQHAHIPLPREIFNSLITVVTSEAYGAADKSRSADRLQLEMVRAGFILCHNVDEMDFMRAALGYNPVNPDRPVPYYLPQDLCMDDIIRAREEDPECPLFITAMRLRDSECARQYLELCLNGYQVELERRTAQRQDLATYHRERKGRSDKMLQGLASRLYGADHAVFMVDGLKNLIDLDAPKDVQKAFREKFLRNPGFMTPLLKGQNAESEKISLFFRAVEKACEIERIYEINGPDVLLKQAQEKLEHFLRWRSDSRTQTLIDWFEHNIIIEHLHKNAIDAALINAPHPDRATPHRHPK